MVLYRLGRTSNIEQVMAVFPACVWNFNTRACHGYFNRNKATMASFLQIKDRINHTPGF